MACQSGEGQTAQHDEGRAGAGQGMAWAWQSARPVKQQASDVS